MNRRFLLVALVLALATVALFLHWLSADPTEPRFQATSSPPRLRPGTLLLQLPDRPPV